MILNLQPLFNALLMEMMAAFEFYYLHLVVLVLAL